MGLKGPIAGDRGEPTRASGSSFMTTSTSLTRIADHLTKHAVTPLGCPPLGLTEAQRYPVDYDGFSPHHNIIVTKERRGQTQLSNSSWTCHDSRHDPVRRFPVNREMCLEVGAECKVQSLTLSTRLLSARLARPGKPRGCVNQLKKTPFSPRSKDSC